MAFTDYDTEAFNCQSYPIHLFIKQMCIGHLLCVRHCVRDQIKEQTRQTSLFPHASYLVGNIDIK